MFLKIMGALPGDVYAQDADGLYVNLFIGSRAEVDVKGAKVRVQQTTRYPWDSEVRLAIDPERPATFAVNLRLPGWCSAPRLEVNGRRVSPLVNVRGYAQIEREWRPGDGLRLVLPMQADPQVEADRGRIAIQRGPLIYCLEGADQSVPLRRLRVPAHSRLEARWEPGFLGGVTVIRGSAEAALGDWPGSLYAPEDRLPRRVPVSWKAIPYYANANRTPCEMRVWLEQ